MRLNDISLKFKVGGAFTAIIFMALLFGIFSWTNTKKVQGMLGEIASWTKPLRGRQFRQFPTVYY